jgi:phosphoribosylglycinamide formyltransferase 1
MNIAIFASGGGSNAEVIIKTLPTLLLEKKTAANIALVVTNNTKAGVIQIAAQNNIPCCIINLKSKAPAEIDAIYLSTLTKYKIDFIVLAGYLKKIPASITSAFPKRIINIHPALLPAYGGAGMYGIHVHNAVVQAGEKESGITIHYVNDQYDDGAIIFQASCALEIGETGESLAKKVLALEHAHYTNTIVEILFSQNLVK